MHRVCLWGDLGRQGMKRRLYAVCLFFSGSSSTEQAREGRNPCPSQPTLSPLRLHALLISLVLLLLLLGGVSLLAWRMVQRRVKGE